MSIQDKSRCQVKQNLLEIEYTKQVSDNCLTHPKVTGIRADTS